MRLQPNKGPPIVVPAVARDPLPHHPNVELCTIEAFARELRQRSDISEEDILVAVLQHTPVEPTHGKGADSPDIAPLLAEFSDVLASEIPGGLPPGRFAADGSPIECGIETAPDAKPYARPPRQVAPEQRKQLDTLGISSIRAG